MEFRQLEVAVNKVLRRVTYIPIIVNILLLLSVVTMRATEQLSPSFSTSLKLFYRDNVQWVPLILLATSVILLFVRVKVWLRIATIATIVMYLLLVWLFPNWIQVA